VESWYPSEKQLLGNVRVQNEDLWSVPLPVREIFKIIKRSHSHV